MRTRLRAPQGSVQTHLHYDQLLQIGCIEPQKDDFHWFWRGDLKDFDRQNRFFERWLCAMLVRLLRVQQGPDSADLESFRAYDNFSKHKHKGIAVTAFLRAPRDPKNEEDPAKCTIRQHLLDGLQHASHEPENL